MHCALYFFKVRNHDKEEYCVERISICKREKFYEKLNIRKIIQSLSANDFSQKIT